MTTRQNAFALDVRTDELLALADKLDGVTPASITAALVRAVQTSAERFDQRARKGMNAGIALTDSYVSSRMSVEAPQNRPEVTITAAGPGRAGRKGLTILGHYNPRTITGKLSRPGGVVIEATRGKPQTLTRRTFMMRLKRGTAAGDQFGVFERLGPDSKNSDGSIRKRNWRHLYGVSPYSLFRHQIEAGSDQLREELQREALDELAKVVNL